MIFHDFVGEEFWEPLGGYKILNVQNAFFTFMSGI
jgi:hypothetical protein